MAAFNQGAQSVGLFRTEMLHMDRPSAPSEDELYNIFCQALEPAAGRSIIVRTMDIGGDKPVAYLNIPAENNPFLGYRAVRIYEEYQALFHTQLRADFTRLGARLAEDYDPDDFINGRDPVGERATGGGQTVAARRADPV